MSNKSAYDTTNIDQYALRGYRIQALTDKSSYKTWEHCTCASIKFAL